MSVVVRGGSLERLGWSMVIAIAIGADDGVGVDLYGVDMSVSSA